MFRGWPDMRHLPLLGLTVWLTLHGQPVAIVIASIIMSVQLVTHR